MTVIAATGHRPPKLGGYGPQVGLALGGLATEYLSREQPDEVISGMALGWDQAVAAACVALDIPFTAAVPFEGQDSLWPAESRARYRRLLACAKHVEIVTPGEVMGRAADRAMQVRNEWMVDRAHRMVALWDGSWGGTFNCIAYARQRDVPIDNLWARWTLPEDLRELLK